MVKVGCYWFLEVSSALVVLLSEVVVLFMMDGAIIESSQVTRLNTQQGYATPCETLIRDRNQDYGLPWPFI